MIKRLDELLQYENIKDHRKVLAALRKGPFTLVLAKRAEQTIKHLEKLEANSVAKKK